MTSIYLFVYGTLKRGQRNHHLLAGQEFVGPAITLPHYRIHDCGSYPCMVRNTRHGVGVHGEVYEVDEPTLAKLDELEGAPSLFSLQTIELEVGPAPVFAYLYNHDVSTFRDCGASWPS